MNYNKAIGILELPYNTTGAEIIKQQYRTLAKRYHPDKNPDGEEHFKLVQEAYEYLTKSDNNGPDIPEDALQGQFGSFFSNIINGISPLGGNPINNLFGNTGNTGNTRVFTSDFLNAWKSDEPAGIRFFRQEVSNNNNNKPKDTVCVDLVVSLREFFNGGEYKINFRKLCLCNACLGQPSLCELCKGVGKIISSHSINNCAQIQARTCNVCLGKGNIFSCEVCNKGLIHMSTSVDVEIPCYNNSWHCNFLTEPLVVRGEGHESVLSNGDLHVNIKIVDMEFTVKDFDVYVTKIISLKDSLLGTHININSFDGTVVSINDNNYIIKEGDGYSFNDKGLYNPEGTRGKLWVVFKVKCPKRLTSSQRKAVESIFVT